MRSKQAKSKRRGLARLWPVGLAACIALAAPLICGVVAAQQQDAPIGADASLTPGDQIAQGGQSAQGDYVIGPEDKLSIQVFQVKDLSFPEVVVDSTGQIQLPLIGKVMAAGKTAQGLQDEIAQRLGSRYLQSPEVSVTVLDSASQKVTVEGEVKQPGVFQMKGRTTLMQAIAMAGGMADDADLRKVAIIRDYHGLRKAAVCDYDRIRTGRAIDPPLQGDDIVVVDGSRAKMFWSATVKTLPLFTIFAYLR